MIHFKRMEIFGFEKKTFFIIQKEDEIKSTLENNFLLQS
jgi:hypothetical protein